MTLPSEKIQMAIIDIVFLLSDNFIVAVFEQILAHVSRKTRKSYHYSWSTH